MAMSIGGILDFSTRSESTVVNQSYADSFNKSANSNRVLDNVGNLNLTIGGAGNESTLDKVLPVAAVLLIVFALLR